MYVLKIVAYFYPQYAGLTMSACKIILVDMPLLYYVDMQDTCNSVDMLVTNLCQKRSIGQISS